VLAVFLMTTAAELIEERSCSSDLTSYR